tara:strand:- start:83794 stop:84267 length:474 start_codon:yes stop_codon:yes gene_type:complete
MKGLIKIVAITLCSISLAFAVNAKPLKNIKENDSTQAVVTLQNMQVHGTVYNQSTLPLLCTSLPVGTACPEGMPQKIPAPGGQQPAFMQYAFTVPTIGATTLNYSLGGSTYGCYFTIKDIDDSTAEISAVPISGKSTCSVDRNGGLIALIYQAPATN